MSQDELNRWQGGVVGQARTLATPWAFDETLGETLFVHLKEVRNNSDVRSELAT